MAPPFFFLLVLFLSALVSCSQVIVLESLNFEHETQASSGTTPGDWLIQFYAPSVLHLQAMWTEIAEVLKDDGLHVAKIDAMKNKDVASRFNIQVVPSIIYISKGFVYTYSGDTTTEDIVQFARSPYRRLDGTPVPPMLSTQERVTLLINSIKTSYFIGIENSMNEVAGGVFCTTNQIWSVAPFFVVFFIGRLFGKLSANSKTKHLINANTVVNEKKKVLFGPEAAREQLEKAELEMKAGANAIEKAKAAVELQAKQPLYDVDDWSSDDTGATDRKKKSISKKKTGKNKKK